MKEEAIAAAKAAKDGGTPDVDALESAWIAVVESMESRRAFDVAYLAGIQAVHDSAPIAVIPIERAAFVKAKTTVTLVDGVLSDVRIERPSSFGAAITSPIDAARKVVSVITDVVQIKHNSEVAAEAADKKEAEEAAAAKESKTRERNARTKQYLAARNLVEQKKAAYAVEDWTKREPERIAAAGAIVQAMLDANEKAQLAGQPVPYSDADMYPFLK